MSAGPGLGRAYLLAAGRGRRADGPKAWLSYEGVPLLERQVLFLSARLGPERVAVSIQPAWAERCARIHPGVAWVPASPEEAPMSSLKALLAAAPPSGWCSVHHVDMPVWDAALFDALEARLPEAETRGCAAVVPAVAGRRGHPVLLSLAAAREAAGLDPARDRLDLWLRGKAVLEAGLDFPCALENWNRPGDLHP